MTRGNLRRKTLFYSTVLPGTMHEPPETVAIDIVLLLPGPIMDMVIGVNRTQLAGNPGGGIRLGREDSLPHISVAMLPEIITGIDFPVRFEAAKAALCHLGSHCTCRKVLATFDLGVREPVPRDWMVRR